MEKSGNLDTHRPGFPERSQYENLERRKRRNWLDSALGNWSSRALAAAFLPCPRLHMIVLNAQTQLNKNKEDFMGNIFYIIGVIVVVLFILGYLGLR
jgi:hypothetical protein